MTRLGLGCVSLGSGAGRRVGDDIRLVRTAIDLGVTVFDTADAYGAGASEYVLGRAVKGRREDVVIATKGGFNFRDRSRAEQWFRRWAKPAVEAIRRPSAALASRPGQYDHRDFSPRHLREAVRGSLRRLRTDRIDVYQIHAPTHVLPDLIEQLSDLVAIGDVGRFGVGAQTVETADGWIVVPGISMVQVPFGILDPEAASTTLPLAREHGREVWARGVFGGGLLALAERDPGALVGDPKWEPIQALRRAAAEAGVDSFQLALGFLRAHADVSTVLIGSTSVEHLERNARLFEEPPLEERLLRAAARLLRRGVVDRGARMIEPGDADDDDQVIVIGSGPCGATAAGRLVERGVRVVMLDAGLGAPSGELVRLAGRTVWRRKGWAEFSEHRHDNGDDDVVWASSLSLGGLSNYWTSAIPRFAPEDFVDGEQIDERYEWPVTYDELVPYYDVLEPAMGLTAGEPFRGVPEGRAQHRARLPRDWRSVAARAAVHRHGVGVLPMARGGPWMFVRRGTEFSSYHCMVAPLLTSSPSIFRLRTGAYVTRLNWSSTSNRVESVGYVDRRTGAHEQLRGRAVVVAAGAIDSTVILLRSRSSDFPDGLGNATGLVGRYLHDHPREWWTVETRPALTALAHPVYVSRTDHAESDPMMATSLTLGLDSLRGRLRTFYGGQAPALGVQVLGTMIPTPDVGVSIGSWEGSRPTISLRYDDAAVKNLVAARDRIREVLASAGIDAKVPGPFHALSPGSSYHYAGSVRMHEKPEFGVLDRWNRMHDAPNVAVVDASCFPTGPEKNPTLTAMALAARAADRLADDITRGTLD